MSDFFQVNGVYKLKSSTTGTKYYIENIYELSNPEHAHEDLNAVAIQEFSNGKQLVVVLRQRSFDAMERI